MKLSKDEIFSRVDEIEGWLSREVIELLVEASFNRPQGTVVEIGSWKGKSTVALALSNKSNKIIAIDPFTGSIEHEHLYGKGLNTFDEFIGNLKKFEVLDQITPMVMTSVEAAREFSGPISLLWIDGSHEYEDVTKDLFLWYDQVVEGGYILFHDSKWPGVKKVLWEEFIPKRDLGIVRRVEDTTYARKLGSVHSEIWQRNQDYLKLEKNKHRLKKLKRKLKKLKNRKENE